MEYHPLVSQSIQRCHDESWNYRLATRAAEQYTVSNCERKQGIKSALPPSVNPVTDRGGPMSGSTQARTLLRAVACCALALFAFASPVRGQELRGRVQGSVTDSTGAVVAGAVVRLTNDQTGVGTSRTTSNTGQYIFDFVSAGNYTLHVEMAGFRQFVQRNILVQTRSDVTV